MVYWPVSYGHTDETVWPCRFNDIGMRQKPLRLSFRILARCPRKVRVVPPSFLCIFLGAATNTLLRLLRFQEIRFAYHKRSSCQEREKKDADCFPTHQAAQQSASKVYSIKNPIRRYFKSFIVSLFTRSRYTPFCKPSTRNV